MKTVCSSSLFFPSFGTLGTLFLEMNLRTRNMGVLLGGRSMCVGFVRSLGKQLQILIYFSIHKRCQEPEILFVCAGHGLSSSSTFLPQLPHDMTTLLFFCVG